MHTGLELSVFNSIARNDLSGLSALKHALSENPQRVFEENQQQQVPLVVAVANQNIKAIVAIINAYPDKIIPLAHSQSAQALMSRKAINNYNINEIIACGKNYHEIQQLFLQYENGAQLADVFHQTLLKRLPPASIDRTHREPSIKYPIGQAYGVYTLKHFLKLKGIFESISTDELQALVNDLLDYDELENKEANKYNLDLLDALGTCQLDLSIPHHKLILTSFLKNSVAAAKSNNQNQTQSCTSISNIYFVRCLYVEPEQFDEVFNDLITSKVSYVFLSRVAEHLPELFAPERKVNLDAFLAVVDGNFMYTEMSVFQHLSTFIKKYPELATEPNIYANLGLSIKNAAIRLDDCWHKGISWHKAINRLNKLLKLKKSRAAISQGLDSEQIVERILTVNACAIDERCDELFSAINDEQINKDIKQQLKLTLTKMYSKTPKEEHSNEISRALKNIIRNVDYILTDQYVRQIIRLIEICTQLNEQKINTNIFYKLSLKHSRALSEQNFETTLNFLEKLSMQKPLVTGKMNLTFFSYMVRDSALLLLEKVMRDQTTVDHALTIFRKVFLAISTQLENGAMTKQNSSAYIQNSGAYIWIAHHSGSMMSSFFTKVVNAIISANYIDDFSQNKVNHLVAAIINSNIGTRHIQNENEAYFPEHNNMRFVTTLIATHPELLKDETLNQFTLILQASARYVSYYSFVQSYQYSTDEIYNAWKQGYTKLIDRMQSDANFIAVFPHIITLDDRIGPELLSVSELNSGLGDLKRFALYDAVLCSSYGLLNTTEQQQKTLIGLLKAKLTTVRQFKGLESIKTKSVWVNNAQSIIHAKPEVVRRDIEMVAIRAIVGVFSSACGLNNDAEYQMANSQLNSLLHERNPAYLVDRLLFMDSIMLRLVKENTLCLASKSDWQQINHIRRTVQRLDEKIRIRQVFTRWFIGHVLDSYQNMHRIFQNFDQLQQIYQRLREFDPYVMRTLCETALSLLLKERPDIFIRDTDVTEKVGYLAEIVNALISLWNRFDPHERSNNILDAAITTGFAGTTRTDLVTDPTVLIRNFLTMILRINRNFDLTEDQTISLVRAINNIKSINELKKLKLVLQYCESIGELSIVLDREYLSDTKHPTLEQFKSLDSHQQTEWLQYYSTMRVRQGLAALSHVLKNANSYSDQDLCLMLTAFKRISVPQSVGKVSRIIKLFEHHSTRVQAAAIYAAWFVDQNPDNKNLMDQLLHICLQSNNIDVQTAALNTLTFYNIATDTVDEQLNALVVKSNTIQSRDLLKEYALLFSRVPHRPALLRAAQIVNSDVWNDYTHFNHHHENRYIGDFLMFMSRNYWEDNRPLMRRRIERMLGSITEPNHNHDVIDKTLQSEFEDLRQVITAAARGTRYENVQLELPENTVLLRGLCPRHGSKLEKKAVIDFLLKGSGSSELQGQNDDKASHAAANNIYSGNNITEVLHYYKQNSGILMAIKSEYFNQESAKGFVRTQIELGRHFVFLRGVPLHAIQNVIFPEGYRQTIELLFGDTPIAELKTLTHFKFKQLDKHLLKQIRRNIRSINNKILFINTNQDVREFLDQHDLTTPTDEQIAQLTCGRHIHSRLVSLNNEIMWIQSPRRVAKPTTALFQTDFLSGEITDEKLRKLIEDFFPFLIQLKNTNIDPNRRGSKCEFKHSVLNKFFTIIRGHGQRINDMIDRQRKIHVLTILFSLAGRSMTVYKHCDRDNNFPVKNPSINYRSKAIANHYLRKNAALMMLTSEDCTYILHAIDANCMRFHDDDEFKHSAEQIFKTFFPNVHKALDEKRNTHGHVSVAVHTLQTVIGRETHHGLCSDALPKFRNILRLVCFLHDTGKSNMLINEYRKKSHPKTKLSDHFDNIFNELNKFVGHSDHVKGSTLVARGILLEKQTLLQLSCDEIDLISLLVLDNDLFGRLLNVNDKHNMSIDEFKIKMQNSWQLASKLTDCKLDQRTYFKLLYTAYLADAGTVSTVRRHFDTFNDIYRFIMDDKNSVDDILKKCEAVVEAIKEAIEQSKAQGFNK